MTYFNIVTIQIESVVLVIEDLSRVLVSCIARHIIRKHQNDVVIRYPQPFHCPETNKNYKNEQPCCTKP